MNIEEKKTTTSKPNVLTSLKFEVEKIRVQVKKWQEKLLDMSKSNPLLGLNRARSVKFKIKSPDYLTFFEKLIQEEAELKLPFVKKKKKKKIDESLEENPEEENYIYEVEEGDMELEYSLPADLRRKLKRLYDNARTTIEERGVVTLYITLGAIRWNDDALGESVSPIILIPCEFVYKGPNTALKIKMTDEEIQLNPAVNYYFREKHKIEFPELPGELDKETLQKFFKNIEKIVHERDWQLSDEVWVGTFSFESLVLYQDLKLLVEMACANPLIAALAHALNSEPEASEALPEDIDSLKTPEIVPIPILPADSSQLQALAYAAASDNLVVHGPPGTGKSQTISNIIADALGKNKKVLFVSAKMAALNVVFNRLKNEGLGQFCLEAHGVKAGKLKIIEDLKRTIESDDFNNMGSIQQELDNLQKTKKQLNEYVIALHKIIQPANRSVFQAIGRYSKLKGVVTVKGSLPWEDILEVTTNDIDSHIEALYELAQMGEVFLLRKKHPLRGLEYFNFSLQFQEKLERDLKYLSGQFSDIVNNLERLHELLPVRNFSFESLRSIIPALDALSKISKLPEKWWKLEINQIENKKAVFAEAASLANEFNEKKKTYFNFSESSFRETLATLEDIDKKFKSILSRISLAYLKWRKLVKTKLRPGIKFGFSDLKNYYSLTNRLLELESWFNERKPILSEEVRGEGITDQVALQEAVDQCGAAILIRSSSYKWDGSEVTVLDPEMSNGAATLVSFFNTINDAVLEASKRIDGLWPKGFSANNITSANIPFEIFCERSKEVLSNLDKLREWTLLQQSIKRCEDLSLGEFINSFEDKQTSELPLAFEKRVLTLWIDANISRIPCLAEFSRLKQQELKDKLRLLDARIKKLANMYIKASAASASRRVKSAQSGLGNGSEVGILRFEMQKRKRIKPLRKLFSEIPHVLQALKPCMLMSPISVSTYLKPESFHFDLVIFDEASQLPTPEAIPSILRADQVIVAGDPNQLPPTSFFDTSLFSEDDENFDEEPFQSSLESLLDDCVASVPVFRETYLKWHYRSRDERLISFSNNYFYENRLITFPSSNLDSDGRGIKLEYVADGVWDRGKSRTNRREARRAAQLAIEHFSNHPEKSLGIVALNTSQKEAIEDAINDELANRPNLLPFFDTSKEEGFFVKSLENVQGDERDVMMISIGYGKSADGAFTLNFGPLNTDGGWRRLNVLVTRAKWQIILVTSLRSAELHRINPQNRGALSLKNYIEYCERGGSLPPNPAKIIDIETNDFEDSVREVLADRGYKVDAQVGAGSFRIDLAIRDPRDPSKYLIGVECDGATYHSSKVARDRDLMREEILKDMGWRLHRVWSTEWFRSRDTAIKLMIDNIERAMDKDSKKSMPAATIIDDKDFELKPIPAPKLHRKHKPGTPYEKYKKRFQRKILIEPKNQYRLENILKEIVEVEGPIHQDILEERVKEVFKVQKIGANITKNIESGLRLAVHNKTLMRKKPFIWSTDSKLANFRIPSDELKRTLKLISPQEISLAILYLVEDQFGIMKEQIPHAVAKIFEDQRMDPDEVDLVRETADQLIEGGALVVNGNQVNLNNP